MRQVSSNDFVRDFGDRVREIRLERGLSQEALADKAGLHRTAVSFVERALRSATLETVEKLAIALEVEASDLMPKIRAKRRASR